MLDVSSTVINVLSTAVNVASTAINVASAAMDVASAAMDVVCTAIDVRVRRLRSNMYRSVRPQRIHYPSEQKKTCDNGTFIVA
jgi:hypothetical protein